MNYLMIIVGAVTAMALVPALDCVTFMVKGRGALFRVYVWYLAFAWLGAVAGIALGALR